VDTFLLQDWTSILVTGATPVVVQSEEKWLDLDGYRDLVMWLEVKSVTQSGYVVLDYQTSPVPDENYFVTMWSETLAASSTPAVKTILSTATTPLEVWLRWKLRVSGIPPSDWGACFRIHCAVNGKALEP
jgi:hypothetical protein